MIISKKQISMLMDDVDDTTPTHYIEDKVNFLIDQYPELMSIYRTIISAEFKCKKKIAKIRAMAKIELDRMREAKENRDKRITLTEEVKNDLYQEEQYYKKMLEYDTEELIKHKDTELTYTAQVAFVLEYKNIFRILEKQDLKIRKGLGFIAEKSLAVTTWPVIWMIEKYNDLTDSKKTKEFLGTIFDFVEDLDVRVGESIRNP